MKRNYLYLAGCLALATTSPAHAEKSDRIVVEDMRTRIEAARGDLGTNGAGSVELAEADNRLRDLFTALDNNESADVRASIRGIEALIAAARVRADASTRSPVAAPARWTPRMAPDERARLLKGWRGAVRVAIIAAHPEDA